MVKEFRVRISVGGQRQGGTLPYWDGILNFKGVEIK